MILTNTHCCYTTNNPCRDELISRVWLDSSCFQGMNLKYKASMVCLKNNIKTYCLHIMHMQYYQALVLLFLGNHID